MTFRCIPQVHGAAAKPSPTPGRSSRRRSTQSKGIRWWWSRSNIFALDNGQILEINSAKEARATQDSKIASGYVFIDGLGVGDVGEVVIRDRQVMAQGRNVRDYNDFGTTQRQAG